MNVFTNYATDRKNQQHQHDALQELVADRISFELNNIDSNKSSS
jgi:hypothetical protein